MNGFSIKINEEFINIALDSGSVGILISNKEGNLEVCINGMDCNGVYYVWYNKEMIMNQSIDIEFKTISHSVISKPIFIRNVNDTKHEEKLLLESYHKLKNDLLAQGLIPNK